MKKMKKITFLIMMCILALSCANAQNNPVPFQVAKRYFIKNNYPTQNLHMLKINDEEKFNSIFGMATVMGEGGQPTPIDFSKQLVIALIDDESDTTEDILIKSITKNGDQLHLTYQIKQQKKSSNQKRLCTIAILDNQYMGTVTASPFSEDGSPIMGGDLDELGCKPSTGYSYSILENQCIAPWESKYALEGDLSFPLLFSKDNTKAEVMGLNLFDKKYGQNLILTKSGKNWSNGDLTLIKTQKNHFVLKDKNKEILKGNLRK